MLSYQKDKGGDTYARKSQGFKVRNYGEVKEC